MVSHLAAFAHVVITWRLGWTDVAFKLECGMYIVLIEKYNWED